MAAKQQHRRPQLVAHDNAIGDLSALATLESLEDLVATDNNISDLAPLLTATGLSCVDLRRNPIDCADQAQNIQALRDRGMRLYTDCS